MFNLFTKNKTMSETKPFGTASDGTRFDETSDAVIAYRQAYPDVELDAAIGSVINIYENQLAGGTAPVESAKPVYDAAAKTHEAQAGAGLTGDAQNDPMSDPTRHIDRGGHCEFCGVPVRECPVLGAAIAEKEAAAAAEKENPTPMA